MILTAKTYSHDLPLFRELGLKPFETNNQDEIFVGEYANIKIFVSCYPAKFWRFEIYPNERNPFEISTGSGDLTTFWPSVLLFADNMIALKPL